MFCRMRPMINKKCPTRESGILLHRPISKTSVILHKCRQISAKIVFLLSLSALTRACDTESISNEANPILTSAMHSWNQNSSCYMGHMTHFTWVMWDDLSDKLWVTWMSRSLTSAPWSICKRLFIPTSRFSCVQFIRINCLSIFYQIHFKVPRRCD